jgi:hypothetical protein
MKLPANVFDVDDDPASVMTGTVVGGYGNCPIGIRMFERNRLRRSDAVAGPFRWSSSGLLPSNTESSIVAEPMVTTSMAGSEVLAGLPRP